MNEMSNKVIRSLVRGKSFNRRNLKNMRKKNFLVFIRARYKNFRMIDLDKVQNKILPGEIAFKLYDTLWIST